MTKNKNILIAEKTLTIIKSGEYNTQGRLVSVKKEIKKSVDNTFTCSPEELTQHVENAKNGSANNFLTEISVRNCSTLEAIQEENGMLKVGVLNFASAKNPGGGFLGGASAQEESLARSSSLYAALTKDMTMYACNKKASFLYSDYIIYSPDVVFWANDEGDMLGQYITADVITSPAPNRGAVIQMKRRKELEVLEEVFKARVEKVLALALQQKIECLILGAWGCGVFRNEPKMVAGLFKEAIENSFKGQFKKIVFAVLDRSKAQPVFQVFDTILKN